MLKMMKKRRIPTCREDSFVAQACVACEGQPQSLLSVLRRKLAVMMTRQKNQRMTTMMTKWMKDNHIPSSHTQQLVHYLALVRLPLQLQVLMLEQIS